jgi:hypothetical protein
MVGLNIILVDGIQVAEQKLQDFWIIIHGNLLSLVGYSICPPRPMIMYGYSMRSKRSSAIPQGRPPRR